jgi:hypothetical protein
VATKTDMLALFLKVLGEHDHQGSILHVSPGEPSLLVTRGTGIQVVRPSLLLSTSPR